VRQVTGVHHDNAYGYVTITASQSARVTVGVSADVLTDVFVDTTQVNPKFGFTWKTAGPVTVRAAAFRALKRTLIGSQTIEPTQVGGFNQFFDDIVGTDSWRYGVGVDVVPLRGGNRTSPVPTLLFGAEISTRDLKVPVGFLAEPGTMSVLDHGETLLRSYAYWTPHRSVAVATEYFIERFVRDETGMNDEGLVRSTSHRVPIQVSFYHPAGWFLKARTTFAHQRGRFLAASRREAFEGHSSFGIVDVSAGYRFPKRWGVLTLDILNAFDTDVTFQEGNPSRSFLSRQRAAFAGLKLPIW
jgi:hypothetical protein